MKSIIAPIMAMALAGLVSGCASSTAGNEMASSDAAGASGAKKICKNMKQTGSNFPQKVCSTEEEWAELERQGREGAERFEEQRRTGATEGVFE